MLHLLIAFLSLSLKMVAILIWALWEFHLITACLFDDIVLNWMFDKELTTNLQVQYRNIYWVIELLQLANCASWSSSWGSRVFCFLIWFLEFFIKEGMFGFLNKTLKILPIHYWIGGSVYIQFGIALLISLCFGTFSDVNVFGNFIPNRIWNSCVFLNDFFKRFSAWYLMYQNFPMCS